MNKNTGYLDDKIKSFRKTIMDVCYRTQCGHPSSALSCIDIMTVLYCGGILRFNPKQPSCPERDRFILSKGHAGIGLYCILEDMGLITREDLYSYCHIGSILGGHLNRNLVPGTEFSAGSLGHGLAYAMGQAINLKCKGLDYTVYVLLGDGECQEGSVWESALCAANHKLDNLVVIIDNNKLQGSDFTENISCLEPFAAKWKDFGFEVREIDGHSVPQIYAALSDANTTVRPQCIIAHTKKGHGVPLMEGKNHWHSRRPNKEEWELVKEQLGIEEAGR